MQITTAKQGNRWTRIWRCSDWLRFNGNDCYCTVSIPGDERLSIEIIAEDMARRSFNDSYHQGKKQAGYRRIAGSLTKLGEGREYLSDAELQTLQEAAEILQRLGTAAEKAKREKKRLEEEAKRLQEQREKTAKQALSGRFASDDLVEFAITTLGLHAVANRHDPWSAGWIKHLMRRPHADESLKTAIKSEIRVEHDDILRDIVSTLAYRDQPIETQVQKLVEDLEDQKQRYTSSAVIRELREALAIEETPNVVKLRGKLG
jgi:gas vesicle protein